MKYQEMLREAMDRVEPVADVWEAFQRARKVGGACLQKATHLAASLIKAGVRAYVMIFLPSSQLFRRSYEHHAVVLIPKDSEYLILDPTDSIIIFVKDLEEFERGHGTVILLYSHDKAHMRGRGLLTYARIGRIA